MTSIDDIRRILITRLALGESGPRVAVKDSLDIAGYPTRAGSGALAGAPRAERSAVVVERLLEAGCQLVGKANMHELAYGVTGINDFFGTPTNPRYRDRVPGGSSSGSAAAVAAGLCDFAIGTDTGGSIRTPAACCGVAGLKPSFGRVSRTGAHPAHSTLDCVGPFAARVAMIEQAMTIIDPTFAARPSPGVFRLARVAVEADPEIAESFERAFAGIEAPVENIVLDGFDEAFAANIAIIGAETWAAFAHLVSSPALGADVRARLTRASAVTIEELAWAEEVRAGFTAQVDSALERADALILPTMPCVPPTLDEGRDGIAALRLTVLVRQFNLSGHPALSLPFETASGLPVAVQLVGRKGDDAALCAIGRVIESHLSTLATGSLEAPCR